MLLLFGSADHGGCRHGDCLQLFGHLLIGVEPVRGEVKSQSDSISISIALFVRRSDITLRVQMFVVAHLLSGMNWIEGEFIAAVQKGSVRTEETDIEKVRLRLFTGQGKAKERSRKNTD